MALPGFREALDRDMGEAFRQGGRGPAHDLTLEARPWRVPLERIEVPIEIWHGQDDRVVPPEQSRILARTLLLVTEHLVPGEGHFSLFARHAEEVMQSFSAAPRQHEHLGLVPRLTGQPFEYGTYPDKTHVGVLNDPDSSLPADLERWTLDRLAEVPAEDSCAS